jgi:hypothetical protein
MTGDRNSRDCIYHTSRERPLTLLACRCSARYQLRLITDVTHLLSTLEPGNPRAANRLLPLATGDAVPICQGS